MKGLAAKKSYSERFVQVADTIKEGRIQGVKTDSDLCRAIGLMPQQLNKIRNGSQAVQVVTLEALAEKFNVSPAYLLTGSLPMFLPSDKDTPEEATRRRLVDIVENEIPPLVGKPVSQLFYDKEAISYSAYRAYKKGEIKTPSRHLKGFLEKAYRVNRRYIETGEGEKFLPDKEDKESDKADKPEPVKEFLPKVITVSPDNEDKMILIPQKVAAGYLGNIADPEWVEEQPTISLPDMPRGKTTRAFEIEGDSMLPHFHEGAYVGCTFLENLDLIQEGYVYIVVTDDGVTMKRVFKRGNSLRLTSDNSLYKPFDIPLKEVREIWKVHRAITAQFPPPSETDAKVNHLELEVVKLGKTVALIAQKIGI